MLRSNTLLPAALVIALGFPALSFGQGAAGTIRGKVIDAATRDPLAGVVVTLRGNEAKASTGRDGRFVIPAVPSGTWTVEFELPEYARLAMPDVRVRAGEARELAAELAALVPRPRVQVNVRSDRLPAEERSAPGVTTLSFEEAYKMPGTIMDVSRVLNALPGTSHVSEISNDLIVRGGSPWENAIFVDNVEVPNINHLQSQGGSGGMIGILNALFIEDINFYSGGFAARYGNRMSSIVDIKFREGSRERKDFRLNLNLAGFSAGAEGPFAGGKGSWLVSLSRNYHDLIARWIGYGVAPRFGDVHIKMTFDPSPRNKLTFLNIYGQSRLSYGVEEAVQEGFTNAINYDSRQNTAGLSWLAEWAGGAIRSETTLSYSLNRISYGLTDAVPPLNRTEYILYEEGMDSVVLRNVNSANLSPAVKAELGLDVRWDKGRFSNYFTEYISRWGLDIPAADVEFRPRSAMGGAFLTFFLQPWKPLRLSAGLRADHFGYNGRTSVSPRLSASFTLGGGVALTGSVGMFRQVLPLALLASHFANRSNRDPQAIHAVVGLKYDPSESFRLSLELYDKEYRAMPLSPENPNIFIMDSGLDFELFRTYEALQDTGTARARGLEIFLQKRAAENLYGMVSVSLFRSQFRDCFGVLRARANDNRFIVTIVAGYKPGGSWNLGFRWNWAGGVPYTPYDEEASRQVNRGIVDRTLVYGRRLPDYMTFNFRIDRRWAFRRSELDVFLSLVNAFNRKNVDRYVWNRIENRLDVIYQAPLIPVFGAEFRF